MDDLSGDIPSFMQVGSLFTDECAAIDYLKRKGLIYDARSCEKCENSMTIYENRPKLWRCTTCRTRCSIFEGSMFARSHLKVNHILFLMWLFLLQTPVTKTMAALGISAHTACNWYQFLRVGIADGLNEQDLVIGGDNVIVEIDESKFAKRKYHRGKRKVMQEWVLGGIERTAEGKCFMEVVAHRDAETLLRVIHKYVKPGTVIYTDCWAAYNVLDDDPLYKDHKSVNHSKHFKDPDTGVHTNTIEGVWNGAKLLIRPQRRRIERMAENLFEYIFRKQNKGNTWNALFDKLKDVEWNEVEEAQDLE